VVIDGSIPVAAAVERLVGLLVPEHAAAD